jgi:hypothetical protein
MLHATLSSEKWNTFPLIEQLANIGSEVERSIKWREKNYDYMMLAVYRALELIDLTLHDPKNMGGLKEIARIREFIIDYFLGTNIYGSSDVFWQKYFMVYTRATALRKTFLLQA